MCEKIKDSDSDLLENCYVIFVSNDAKQVPIWFQRSGHISRDNLCIWVSIIVTLLLLSEEKYLFKMVNLSKYISH